MRRILGAAVLWSCAIPLSVGELGAWGDTGHQIVCEIAFQEMSRAARDEVVRLIRKDPEYRFFNEACTWPDHPRKRASEHYLNVPRNFTDVHTANCPQASECLYTAIEHEKSVLGDSGSSDSAKLEALKFLGHWIGDIHQPLHVSYQDDRGGNEIRVSGSCFSNLHSTWDTCLVEEGIGRDVRKAAEDLRLSDLDDAKRKEWIDSAPVDWANESYQLAVSPEVDYCTWKQGACWYSPANKELTDGETLRSETIDMDYIKSHTPTVRQRVLQAGVRLAHLLDGLLAP
jgi:hypothetical protein